MARDHLSRPPPPLLPKRQAPRRRCMRWRGSTRFPRFAPPCSVCRRPAGGSFLRCVLRAPSCCHAELLSVCLSAATLVPAALLPGAVLATRARAASRSTTNAASALSSACRLRASQEGADATVARLDLLTKTPPPPASAGAGAPPPAMAGGLRFLDLAQGCAEFALLRELVARQGTGGTGTPPTAVRFWVAGAAAAAANVHSPPHSRCLRRPLHCLVHTACMICLVLRPPPPPPRARFPWRQQQQQQQRRRRTPSLRC